MPDPKRTKKVGRTSDKRYLEGQKILAEAIRYLVKSGPRKNKEAVSMLSEHFRTQFRMSDRPIH
jgi:hypothetical protein